MEFIMHRINSIDELEQVSTDHGVELDLRDYGDKLVLQHEPFTDGEDFEDYLKNYHHGLMILNIKSEGIENKVLSLINKYSVKDYFFLDSSFPMIHKLTTRGEHNVAIRLSEFEGIDTVLNMSDKAKWVWVDCFSRLPIDPKIYNQLKSQGFKLCLVSPELQNQKEKIPEYRQYLSENNLIFDAICTKQAQYSTWLATN